MLHGEPCEHASQFTCVKCRVRLTLWQVNAVCGWIGPAKWLVRQQRGAARRFNLALLVNVIPAASLLSIHLVGFVGEDPSKAIAVHVFACLFAVTSTGGRHDGHHVHQH